MFLKFYGINVISATYGIRPLDHKLNSFEFHRELIHFLKT